MNEKVKLFLIIFVVYFFVRIISKYRVVEGVDGSESESPPEPPSDPVREPCTIDDVINNNRGDCLGNGTVIGIKVDEDISDCSCDCNDGMRNRRNSEFLENSSISSCIESDRIGNFQCFTECNNELNIYGDILEDENSDKKEACIWVENMLDNCGRKCTLEGGGTTNSDLRIRQFYNENIEYLIKRGDCNFSTDKMIDSVIGDNFIRLLYFCQLFNVILETTIYKYKISLTKIYVWFVLSRKLINKLRIK